MAKLQIYPSIAGQIGVSNTTVAPATTVGDAKLAQFRALTNMTDAGAISIFIDGTEYAVPIIKWA